LEDIRLTTLAQGYGGPP